MLFRALISFYYIVPFSNLFSYTLINYSILFGENSKIQNTDQNGNKASSHNNAQGTRSVIKLVLTLAADGKVFLPFSVCAREMIDAIRYQVGFKEIRNALKSEPIAATYHIY